MPRAHMTRVPPVEGYTNAVGYRPGDLVSVRCASRAPRFDVRVSRVGAERLAVHQVRDVRGIDQEVPDNAWSDGCDWTETFAFEIASDWPPGFYEIELMSQRETDWHNAGHAFFVVRPSRPDPTRPLLVLSTNTYQAYNQWGGRNMYTGGTRASFDRPMEPGFLRRDAAPSEVDYDGRLADTTGADRDHRRLVDYQATYNFPLWSSSSGWHNWERRFVRWAEAAGYSIDVASNTDLHMDPGVLEGRRAVLSVGHDEYWSREMRDHIDSYVEAGGNWAIFSGNTCFWQVRLDETGRMMTCFKSSARTADPMTHEDPSRMTGMWSDPLVGRPENLTTGVSFSRGGYAHVGDATPNSAGGFEIQRPDHWALAGTNLRYGDQLGAADCIVGYEVDGCDVTVQGGKYIATGIDGTPTDFEIVGTAPAHLLSITDSVCEAPEAIWASVAPPGDLEGVARVVLGDDASDEETQALGRGRAVLGTMQRGAGEVFVAGTADWAYGLDGDITVQRVTANVLDRFLAAP